MFFRTAAFPFYAGMLPFCQPVIIPHDRKGVYLPGRGLFILPAWDISAYR